MYIIVQKQPSDVFYAADVPASLLRDDNYTVVDISERIEIPINQSDDEILRKFNTTAYLKQLEEKQQQVVDDLEDDTEEPFDEDDYKIKMMYQEGAI